MVGTPETKEGSIGAKGITQVTSATFVSIILGLVLANCLDNFFRNGSHYDGIVAAVNAVLERGWFSAVVTAQLLILLFSLVRFYLGSSRYHEELPEASGAASELLINLIGAISVFIAFYITSVFIKNTHLFYVGFGLIHFVDLAWFSVAILFLRLNKGMRKVSTWYIIFDGLTLIVLISFLLFDFFRGQFSGYVPQWLALAACFIIGLWDSWKLWPFYTGNREWKESLTKSG